MIITSAKFIVANNKSIKVVIDGETCFVPDDMDNTDRQAVAEWEDEGNTIEPYVEPEKDYADLRREAYASFGDQLDMHYWDSVNNTSLWEDHVAAVKSQYPKPTGGDYGDN